MLNLPTELQMSQQKLELHENGNHQFYVNTYSFQFTCVWWMSSVLHLFGLRNYTIYFSVVVNPCELLHLTCGLLTFLTSCSSFFLCSRHACWLITMKNTWNTTVKINLNDCTYSQIDLCQNKNDWSVFVQLSCVYKAEGLMTKLNQLYSCLLYVVW